MKGRIHIAILMHEHDRYIDLSNYLVYYFAEIWREQGHSVVFIFGTEDYVPADIALLHIDLSVVPTDYTTFSQRYPIVINGRITDICKSNLPENELGQMNDYHGPVIVKTDLNNAGQPEKRLAKLAAKQKNPIDRMWIKLWRVWQERTMGFATANDYLLFDSLEEVPRSYLRNQRLIVQRFLPEYEDGLYHLRVYHFLGSCGNCTRISSDQPIVKSRGTIFSEMVEPHPEIVALRKQMGFDYGKFDYVMHGGQPILIDANKTTGRGSPVVTSERMEKWRERAAGLYSFLEN
ncbi:MAG: hypothetical protein V3U88_02385 [Methylococcales bacterium]